MGKQITSQARGRGSLTFRVKPGAYRYKISYPALNFEGPGRIIKLFNSSGHSSPLIEVEIASSASKDAETAKNGKQRFIVPAAEGVYEGQEIYLGKRQENKDNQIGDILKLKDIKQGTKVFNIESIPGKGGRYFRSSGSSGTVTRNDGMAEVQIKRRRINLHENCRAIMGQAAGDGRLMKPLMKAGKQFHRMKAVGRKWHRTSAVKVNAVDHPFGGGRGKRIKSKIAKRNAPPGRKVGHIRPRKTGRKRR